VPLVTYTVYDGVDTDTSTLTISVTPVNDPLVLPAPIPTPVEPNLSLGFSSVTGLGSETMVMQITISQDSTIYLTGTATFIADENSGLREFTWSIDQDVSLTNGSYSVTFTALTGTNAVIHDPTLFGGSLGSNIHPTDVGWSTMRTLTYTAPDGADATTIGTSGDDVISGTSENDAIVGYGGNDSLTGAIGNDRLFGGAGVDTLTGSEGNDVLVGGSDNDILSGGYGLDLLFGGAGDDELTGGGGADTFVFNLAEGGSDTITDFNLLEGDKLNLADLLSGATTDNLDNYLSMTNSGQNLVLKVDPNGSDPANGAYQITIEGMQLSNFSGMTNAEILNKLQGTDTP
jgi:Ca2+-binding RTX toxin-like protein